VKLRRGKSAGKSKMKRTIAVLDFETDPFEYGKMVWPFVVGFYDGKRYITYWGSDCVSGLARFLEAEDTEYCIYAHNGGRFDFFYLLNHIHHSLRIISGRIVQAFMGKHELRDSYAILPFPLADFDKDSIDYEKFEAGTRERHRDEIISYLRKDCVSLYTLVTAFVDQFGDKLTIGSAAMKQIKARHKFKTGGPEYDAKWRERFYFGGRIQVFRAGITRGDIRIVDINSSYPHAMQSFLHPIGTAGEVSKRIERNSVFVVAEGYNYGAFPTREKDGSLNFSLEYGIFHTTIHEWQAAEDTGTFKCCKVHKAYNWKDRGTFEEFVSTFYDERAKCKAPGGDKLRALFLKYVLNSGYGKFAQNPDNYSDYYITQIGTLPPEWHECGKSCLDDCPSRWSIKYRHDDYLIWSRPLQTNTSRTSWYNIATGASITGAARSVLLRGLSVTDEPLYCDTDSIICRGGSGVEISPSDLGKWSLETSGTVAYIAGKKLYCILTPKKSLSNKELEQIYPSGLTENQRKRIKSEKEVGNLICVKKAHKGARLTAKEIIRITNGEKIHYENPVPNLKFDGTWKFTSRDIQRTV
jgi:hypothetical protein